MQMASNYRLRLFVRIGATSFLSRLTQTLCPLQLWLMSFARFLYPWRRPRLDQSRANVVSEEVLLFPVLPKGFLPAQREFSSFFLKMSPSRFPIRTHISDVYMTGNKVSIQCMYSLFKFITIFTFLISTTNSLVIQIYFCTRTNQLHYSDYCCKVHSCFHSLKC